MKLTESFLSAYKKESFIIRQKASILFFFNFVILIIMPLLLIPMNLFTSREIFSLLNITLIGIAAGMGVSLILLKKGRYSVAAVMTVLTSAFVFQLYSLFGQLAFNNGVIWTIYHTIAVIVLSSLFSGRRMTLVVFFAVVGGGWATILYRNLLGPEETRMVLINFSFDCLLVYIMSYLIHTMNLKTMRKLQEEADDREQQLERTKNLLNGVRDISLEMSGSSTQMAAISNSFSSNAQNQAASAEEITATVEEISAGVERVAESAKEQVGRMDLLISSMKELSVSIQSMEHGVDEATDLAIGATGEARNGESGMSEMNKTINKIGASSREMTGIVGIINDISDRINLLSLNASIEAARAGDAGRGFAVVAEEISKLADQTSLSVKEIDKLIKGTESEITRGMTSVAFSVKTISAIINGVTAISEKIKTIHTNMISQLGTNERVNNDAGMVKNRSEEIFNAANEQKIAAEEIVKSISVINELTQSNASGSEEMASNATQVAKLAESLKEMVVNFKLDNEADSK